MYEMFEVMNEYFRREALCPYIYEQSNIVIDIF